MRLNQLLLTTLLLGILFLSACQKSNVVPAASSEATLQNSQNNVSSDKHIYSEHELVEVARQNLSYDEMRSAYPDAYIRECSDNSHEMVFFGNNSLLQVDFNENGQFEFSRELMQTADRELMEMLTVGDSYEKVLSADSGGYFPFLHTGSNTARFSIHLTADYEEIKINYDEEFRVVEIHISTPYT